MRKSCLLPVLSALALFAGSCSDSRKSPDVSSIKAELVFRRFDKSLFGISDSLNSGDVKSLRAGYGEFFDLFCTNMIRIRPAGDDTVAADLTLFINDPEVRDIQRRVDSVFSRTTDVEDQLQEFLLHYKYYFPEKHVPGIVAYNAVFNYAVVTTDSVIGVGLDMFLGEQEESYTRLGIPRYMFRNFRREYIAPSCVKGWFQSDFDPGTVKGDLISQMIYQGKMLYYTELMLPSLHDSLLTGYSATQLEWCEQNEEKVWAFFIERKLLFSTDPSEYVKYVNDGPTTSGFPPESPGKIGAWIGYRIVKKYMNKNTDITLPELLSEQDAVKILEKSSYKPERGK